MICRTMLVPSLIVLFVTVSQADREISLSVEWNGMNGWFEVRPGRHSGALAEGTFKDSIATNGWGFLEIKTNSLNGSFLDQHQAFAAGLLEARLTRKLIKMQWRNEFSDYCVNNTAYCKALRRFLEENLDYMFRMVKQYGPTEPFWHHVSLVLAQLAGLGAGMKLDEFYVHVGDSLKPNVSWIMQPSLHGDLYDLESKLRKRSGSRRASSCSALIALTDGNKDLLVGHTTWTAYNTMLRIQKKFKFEFHETFEGQKLVPGNEVAFSSYPGRLISGDDFYVLSSGLVVMETTIANYKRKLYVATTPQTVLNWIRNTMANRLASTSEQWAKVYSYNNSGTYNNQWMVIDYKLFKSGSPIVSGTFHVLEQMPGYIRHEDMSQFLQTNRHWPSYNVPYFKDIYNISGWPAKAKKEGDMYRYDRCARAMIFKRDHAKAKDLESLRKLLRYNDYKHDPYSRCNCTPPYSAAYALSSRKDLNLPNGKYNPPGIGFSLRGGTDVKVINASMVPRLAVLIQCGPTNDNQPTFVWSKIKGKTSRHEGHPDVFNFPPVLSEWRY